MESLGQQLLWFSLILLTAGCEENEPSDEGCNQESNVVSIIEKGNTTKGFFSNDCQLFSSDEEAFFVIENDADFRTTVDCDSNLPNIDFDKYTLLIGQKSLAWCCAAALKQKVTKDCEGKKYVYEVEISNPDSRFQALSTFYHWVIINKIPSDYQVSILLE